MNNNQKENAVFDFCEMIHKSWTWHRMTKEEQMQCNRVLCDEPTSIKVIKGSYMDRWRICQALYSAYLSGLGYTDGFWREPNPESVPKF